MFVFFSFCTAGCVYDSVFRFSLLNFSETLLPRSLSRYQRGRKIPFLILFCIFRRLCSRGLSRDTNVGEKYLSCLFRLLICKAVYNSVCCAISKYFRLVLFLLPGFWMSNSWNCGWVGGSYPCTLTLCWASVVSDSLFADSDFPVVRILSIILYSCSRLHSIEQLQAHGLTIFTVGETQQKGAFTRLVRA